jgi:hypothetical protein
MSDAPNPDSSPAPGNRSPDDRLAPESRAARSLTDHAPPAETSDTVRSPPEPGPRLWPRVAGVAILLIGVAAVWTWQNPQSIRDAWHALFPGSPAADGDAAAVQALEQRVARLEQRQSPDLAPLVRRLDALENRPAQSSADLRPIVSRLDAMEAREHAPASAGTAEPADLQPLLARIDVLEKSLAERALDASKLDALAARIATMTASDPAGAFREQLERLDNQLRELAAAEAKLTEASDRAIQLARWRLALDAGRPLGSTPNAPPVLARYATAAPPTLASLRLSFPVHARAALAAGPPDNAGEPFLDRVVARLRDFRLVTVKEGDRVVIGSQTEPVLEHARALLNAGDLNGAVAALATLSGQAADAMAPWLAEAKDLQAARDALASLAGAG